MVWEGFVTYPQSVRFQFPEAAGILDTLEELNPPACETRDRYLNLGDWLRDGVAKGLIRQGEMEYLRGSIGPFM